MKKLKNVLIIFLRAEIYKHRNYFDVCAGETMIKWSPAFAIKTTIYNSIHFPNMVLTFIIQYRIVKYRSKIGEAQFRKI